MRIKDSDASNWMRWFNTPSEALTAQWIAEEGGGGNYGIMDGRSVNFGRNSRFGGNETTEERTLCARLDAP